MIKRRGRIYHFAGFLLPLSLPLPTIEISDFNLPSPSLSPSSFRRSPIDCLRSFFRSATQPHRGGLLFYPSFFFFSRMVSFLVTLMSSTIICAFRREPKPFLSGASLFISSFSFFFRAPCFSVLLGTLLSFIYHSVRRCLSSFQPPELRRLLRFLRSSPPFSFPIRNIVPFVINYNFNY